MTFILVLLTSGCGNPDPAAGTLTLTDANVLPITGGFADPAIAVAAGADLCFDTSVFGAGGASVVLWKTNLSERALRCTLGLASVEQENLVESVVLEAPTSCLSTGTPEVPTLACEEGTTWLAVAGDLDGAPYDWVGLDLCTDSTQETVVFDGVEPSRDPVEVTEATDLRATPGMDYTVDWSGLTQDGFGDPVDPAAVLRLLSRPQGAEETLTDAVVDVESGGVETWVETSGARQIGLAASELGELGAGADYVFGLDQGLSRCLDVSIAVRVVAAP